mmetsp:Transcript_23838/g.70740  ORF Transcript_23838/g.70740 Transcript_23838/m.70740 type:complete len:224 (-) Transcript_23838:1546-2217(-)
MCSSSSRRCRQFISVTTSASSCGQPASMAGSTLHDGHASRRSDGSATGAAPQLLPPGSARGTVTLATCSVSNRGKTAPSSPLKLCTPVMRRHLTERSTGRPVARATSCPAWRPASAPAPAASVARRASPAYAAATAASDSTMLSHCSVVRVARRDSTASSPSESACRQRSVDSRKLGGRCAATAPPPASSPPVKHGACSVCRLVGSCCSRSGENGELTCSSVS